MDVVLLSLPAEGRYASYDLLKAAAQSHAKSAGYAFACTGSKIKKKNGRYIKTLSCRRGGKKYHDTVNEGRKRNKCTHKVDCPVRIRARERPDTFWDLCHIDPNREGDNTHNHPPAEAAAFPEHRQLNEEQIAVVSSHHLAGIRPSRTVAVLKSQFPDIEVHHKDIYNCTAAFAREARHGKSPPEALIDHLEGEKREGRIFLEWEADQGRGGHINYIFIADQRSVDYLNANPDIILLDCTYKTNKFDMPLLHILGVDNMGQSFSVGFCFLDTEKEDSYDKAMRHLVSLFRPGVWPSIIATDCEIALINAIDTHFPARFTNRIICFWHICKNLMVKCKALFETEQRWEEFEVFFKNVIYAKTTEEFMDLVDEFKAEFFFNDGNPPLLPPNPTTEQHERHVKQNLEHEAVKYALGQWIIPHHKQIVHAWIDQFFHAGTTTTSRLEGSHHRVKSWIGKPVKNLTMVWRAIQLSIDDQLNQIMVKRAQEAQRTPIRLSGPFFFGVINKITHHGLLNLHKQLSIVQNEARRVEAGEISNICTGSFVKSYGMPCWHMIKERLSQSQPITSNDFHPHWHINRPPIGFQSTTIQPPILDPLTRQQRRNNEAARRAHQRAFNRQRVAQTGRILSQFESQSQVLRHCSACVEAGHDKMRCRGCRATGHSRNRCPNATLAIRLVAQEDNS